MEVTGGRASDGEGERERKAWEADYPRSRHDRQSEHEFGPVGVKTGPNIQKSHRAFRITRRIHPCSSSACPC